MEYIPKDKVLELWRYWKHIEAYDKTEELNGVDIVRCRDCEKWTNGDDRHGICHWNRQITMQTGAQDFCSYGKRRGEKKKPRGKICGNCGFLTMRGWKSWCDLHEMEYPVQPCDGWKPKGGDDEKIYKDQVNRNGAPNFATAEEVVRCKECRYYVPWDDTCGGCEYLSDSDIAIIGVSGHFFCADGEREGE